MADQSTLARRLRDHIEPLTGQVYFSPECHAEYEALGFSASPGFTGKVALPDGPAYFTSRGSCLGQVPGEVVAATFAVFNPAIVKPLVDFGWSITDAATIQAARQRGAVAQLTRILGEAPDGIERVNQIFRRMVEPLKPAGRGLFAGMLSLGFPGDPMGDLFRAADMLREYRGDSHTAAWISAGLDAIEVGLLTELFIGLPMGTYIRTRAWSPEELDAGKERLRSRGLIDGDGFSPAGKELRESIEAATDRQMAPALDALGDDADELLDRIRVWAVKMVEEGGYLKGPGDLVGRSA
jgi:hypothetical protein